MNPLAETNRTLTFFQCDAQFSLERFGPRFGEHPVYPWLIDENTSKEIVPYVISMTPAKYFRR